MIYSLRCGRPRPLARGSPVRDEKNSNKSALKGVFEKIAMVISTD